MRLATDLSHMLCISNPTSPILSQTHIYTHLYVKSTPIHSANASVDALDCHELRASWPTWLRGYTGLSWVTNELAYLTPWIHWVALLDHITVITNIDGEECREYLAWNYNVGKLPSSFNCLTAKIQCSKPFGSYSAKGRSYCIHGVPTDSYDNALHWNSIRKYFGIREEPPSSLPSSAMQKLAIICRSTLPLKLVDSKKFRTYFNQSIPLISILTCLAS